MESPSVICCYPQPGKAKAQRLCEAFAAGVEAAGGRAKVCRDIPAQLEPGAAFFYGVRPAMAHLWAQAKAEGRDYFYADNSFFDCARERQFRIAKNMLQHKGLGESDGSRLKALGVTVKPMHDGPMVVLATQSPEFIQTVAGDPGWTERMTANLRARYGDRLIVRTKQEARPLLADLKDAGLLGTWSSAAAVTALLEGVRVLCASACCASYAVDRQKWASVLADNQWTLDEIASGMAWKAMNAR